MDENKRFVFIGGGGDLNCRIAPAELRLVVMKRAKLMQLCIRSDEDSEESLPASVQNISSQVFE